MLHDDEWAKKQRKAIRKNPPWVGWPYVVCSPFIIKQWGFAMIAEATNTKKVHKRKNADGTVYTLHPEVERLLRGGEEESDEDSDEDPDEGGDEASSDSSSSEDGDGDDEE